MCACFFTTLLSTPGVAYQCYHGFLRAVQEGNIQWESRTYPYPGTPITQRFSHSQYMLLDDLHAMYTKTKTSGYARNIFQLWIRVWVQCAADKMASVFCARLVTHEKCNTRHLIHFVIRWTAFKIDSALGCAYSCLKALKGDLWIKTLISSVKAVALKGRLHLSLPWRRCRINDHFYDVSNYLM